MEREHTMTRTVAYIRVSTDKQADHGVSLSAQRAKCEAYASLYDLDLVAIVEDAGVSAKTMQRDGLSEALGMLESGAAEALLVVKLDRLTRSVRDLDTLITRYFGGERFALLSVSENIDTRSAAGRLVLNVLASVSQWEREATGERTKAALAHKRSKGERVGECPFGYRVGADGIHLEECPTEQNAIARVIELRGGGLSYRKVAAALNAEGTRARRGGWSSTTVYRLVKNLERPVPLAA